MTRSRVGGAAAVVAALAAALALCAPAVAHVYWADRAGNTIGRVNVDGTSPEPSFVTGASAPRAVAIDGAFVYWAQGGSTGTIGRANLVGAPVPDQAFLSTGGSFPQGLALDATRLYWTHTVSGSGKVGAARVGGSSINPSFVATGPSPCGVAVDGDTEIWANGGAPGSLGRAHGSSPGDPGFITATQDPCGVAVTDAYFYWTNRAGNTIGRASRTGSDANSSFIATEPSPCGVAADGAYLYWTTGTGKVWRTKLDGTGPREPLVTGGQDPCGVAVDPTLEATPSASGFAPTVVGSQSDIQTLFLTNTSSSVLAVSDVRLTGPDAGDFVKIGDGCTLPAGAAGGTPAGGTCVLNVRFDPTAAGSRSATLRVTSNASDSPTDILLTGEAAAAPAPEPGPPDPGPSPLPTMVGLPAPLPPATLRLSPAVGLTLCASTITAGRDGTVTLCKASNPPTAKATATLKGTLPARPARRAASRTVRMGRGRTFVPAGQTRSVTAKLNARGRRALRVRGSLSMRLDVVVESPSGERATVKRRVTLRTKGSRGQAP